MSTNYFVDELSCPPPPKSKKCVIEVAIEIARLKLLKGFSSYNNALCGSSKHFFSTINPVDMGPLDILR